MLKFYSLILTIIIGTTSVFALDVNDSLWDNYTNKKLEDTVRLASLHHLAWDLLKQEPDSSKKLLDIEFDYAKNIGNKKYQAKALNNIGAYYNQIGDIEKGNEYKQKALQLFIELKDELGIAMMYLSFGVSFSGLDQYDLAEEYYNKAKVLYENNNKLSQVAMCIDNIGLIYSNKKDFKKALSFYKESLAIRKKIGKKRRIAITYSNIGFLYSNLFELPLAEIKKLDLIEFKDSISFVSQLLDSAFYYQKKSETIFKELNSKYDLAFTYIGIADIYDKRGNLLKAKSSFKRAYEYAYELDVYISLGQVSIALSKVYKKLGEMDSAYYWLNRHLEYEKIIFNNEKQFQLGKQTSAIKYDLAKKHREEVHQLALDKNQSKIKLLTAISLVAILLFLTAFVIYWYRNKLIHQREFSNGTIKGIEQERKRLAFELHDDIGQQLSMIKTKCFANGDDHVSKIINQSILSVKELSRNLYPSFLTSIGLSAALDDLLDRMEKSTSIHISHEMDTVIDAHLSEDNKLHVYRIIQECINNTLKHSNASSIRIISKVENNEITFIYKDNGHGLKPGEKKKSGIGSYSINERVRMMMGELKIKSSKNGIYIIFNIPFNTVEI